MSGLERGAVAIVTGAAGGIGFAIVSAIVRHGVSVACIDRPGADFGAATEVCAAAGVTSLALEVDVRDREGMIAAAQRATSLGVVRYAVHCAGIDHLEPTIDTATADWSRVLDVNLTGVLFSCLAAYGVMQENGGSIVNIGSASGSIYNRGAVAHSGYSASKAGVIHLSRTLAVEWAPSHIRVNAVSPGYTRTEMTAVNVPERNSFLADQSPMGRMADVTEVAEPVVFLLGDGASFINGVDLPVDGGLTVW